MTRKPTDTCVFCGTGRPTKEHIFGRWMRKHVKTNSTQTIHTTSNTGLGNRSKGKGPSLGLKPKLHRNGPPHSNQLQVSCQICNSGWMGTFQSQASKHLPRLMRGEWPILSKDAMRILACWATMATMVIEFADPDTVAASFEERLSLKNRLLPPNNWQIYLGLYCGMKDPGSFFHRAGHIQFDDPNIIGEANDLQATTLHVGGCFFHILSGPIDMLPNPDIFSRIIGMRRIWPIPHINPSRPNVIFDPWTAWVATKFFADHGANPGPHFGMIV